MKIYTYLLISLRIDLNFCHLQRNGSEQGINVRKRKKNYFQEKDFQNGECKKFSSFCLYHKHHTEILLEQSCHSKLFLMFKKTKTKKTHVVLCNTYPTLIGRNCSRVNISSANNITLHPRNVTKQPYWM